MAILASQLNNNANSASIITPLIQTIAVEGTITSIDAKYWVYGGDTYSADIVVVVNGVDYYNDIYQSYSGSFGSYHVLTHEFTGVPEVSLADAVSFRVENGTGSGNQRPRASGTTSNDYPDGSCTRGGGSCGSSIVDLYFSVNGFPPVPPTENARRDNNHVPVKLGVLFSDGTTLLPIAIDATGLMAVNSTDSIAFTPNEDALRDENFVNVLMAVDSTDATKRCPVYVDGNGAVLIGS